MRQKIIFIDKRTARPTKDMSVFENLFYSSENFKDHLSVFERLNKHRLYTIGVIIDNLEPSLYRNKKFAERTEYQTQSKYKELLYQYFFDEFGDREGNEFYAKLLDKYRPIWNEEQRTKQLDDYIIQHELEPRYRSKIIMKFNDLDKLKKPRKIINWKRYYRLPEPLNHLDWRNTYDNIFVWEIENKKYCLRGGSGSSQQRENNTKFIYGFSLINQITPIPSYIFLYSSENQIKRLDIFNSLTMPNYDIGSNYHIPTLESKKILQKTKLIEWELL